MRFHLRTPASQTTVPLEYAKLALSYLRAAEHIALAMTKGEVTQNYYQGQAVLLLAHHSVELFLKGFIFQLDPTRKVKTHSLQRLMRMLKELDPSLAFDPPFKVEALVPYPALVVKAEKDSESFHELLRYPTNKDGQPWPGLRGFSMDSCNRLLKQIHDDCARVCDVLFP
jgi:HEPN domain-containing protein